MCGVDARKRPTIYRYVFAAIPCTGQVTNESDLSDNKPIRHELRSKDQQFAKLARAVQLDQDAALKRRPGAIPDPGETSRRGFQ